jgi:integrase
MKEDGWRVTKAPRAYPDDIRAMVDALDAMGDAPPPGWNDSTAAGDDEDDDDKPVWFHPVRRDMLRALVLGACYTGGRASDLASYRVHDVGRFPLGIELTLAHTKGARRGSRAQEKRTIFADSDNPRYCGVRAFDRWLDRLAAAKVAQGALFRPVHKSGRVVVGRTDAMDYKADVTGLTRAIRMVAKAAWQMSGKTILQNWRDITIHSFRRNRVMQLLEEDADVFDIEKELGWAHGGAIKEYRDEAIRQDRGAANAKGML